MQELSEAEKTELYDPEKSLEELIIYSGRESSRVAERLHSVLWQLSFFPLSTINRAEWNPNTLCDLWEKMAAEGYENDSEVGVLQSLLKYKDIRPDLLEKLRKQKLETLPQRVKIEAHPPNSSIDGHETTGGYFVCDDYLRELMIFEGNPFDAVWNNKFKLNLERYTRLGISEEHPNGNLGIIKINDKVHIAFTDHPIVGTTPDSRGIISPQHLYATNPNDPFHLALISRGIDFNIGKLLSIYRHYHSTGMDLTANNEI